MREPAWTGMGRAANIATVSPCLLMRLALMKEVGYKVTDDGRLVFQVSDLRKIGADRAAAARQQEVASA
jgi:hypothetical protein